MSVAAKMPERGNVPRKKAAVIQNNPTELWCLIQYVKQTGILPGIPGKSADRFLRPINAVRNLDSAARRASERASGK